MGIKFVALATAILASLTLCTAQAAEPKHGGILKIYHRETPPSLATAADAAADANKSAAGAAPAAPAEATPPAAPATPEKK